MPLKSRPTVAIVSQKSQALHPYPPMTKGIQKSPDIQKSGLGDKREREICVPVVAFRGATGCRPKG